MSYTLGTWDAPEGPLAGTRVEVTRADGKGFTALRVTGPRAAEIRDFVAARALNAAVGQRVARDAIHGTELGGVRLLPAKQRTPHIRRVLRHEHGDACLVYVHGRLRQTRDVILRSLEAYSFHVATTVPGVRVPAIQLVSSASPGPCGAGRIGWCGTAPGEEP